MKLKSDEHIKLLRELALALAQYDSANPYHDDGPLIARACQAAEEIEEGNEKHRELFATLYQVLGAHNASTEVLDAVSNAAVGKYSDDPFSLLPYSPPDTEEIEGRDVPTLELVVKPCGDCWLQIKAPSGRQAAINLGPRGSFNDQTFIGSVILEVAELTRFGGGEGE